MREARNAARQGYNPAIRAAPRKDSTRHDSGAGYLQDALAQLVARAELLASLANLLLLSAVALPLFAMLLLELALAAARTGYGPGQDLLAALESEQLPWLWLGAAVWSMLLAGAALYWSMLLRNRLRSTLQSSTLPEAFAAGLIEPQVIFENTPFPWRLLLPRGDGLRQSLWRVAANLDWYLAPPRRMWRWQWLYNSLLAALVFAAAGLAPLAPLTAALLAVLLLFLLLPVSFLQQRRRIWAEELSRELRRRLLD